MLLHYRTHCLEDYKPWVTFIHGAGGNSAIWFKQLREYKKHFNVLLIDMRGHGKSQNVEWKKGDTFIQIAEEIIEVLDEVGIKKSNFVGISLGTIVIQTIALQFPKRIETMVLGGAITKLNFRTKFYITLGQLGKHILPFMWIYRLFAWIIMPRDNHKEARVTFVNQARKMCQKEFIRWFSLTRNVDSFLQELQKNKNNIPTLFVMGEEDYLFLEGVEDVVMRSKKSVRLESISKAGHVCNIDKSDVFNEIGINFIYMNSEVILPVKTS